MIALAGEIAGEDEALAREAAAGDQAAFARLMERMRTMVYARSYQLLKDHADAEEVTQDVFIRAHRGLAQFRFESSVRTWFYTIATRLSYNRFSYWQRRHRLVHDSLDAPLSADGATAAEFLADNAPTPARVACATEFAALVPQALARCCLTHRRMLELWMTGAWTYEALAEHFQINVGTVKSRLARARAALLTELRRLCPDMGPNATAIEWMEV